jgi:hypothetical protein
MKFFAISGVQRDGRTADGTGIGLGVESSIGGIVVFNLAVAAKDKALH